MTNPKRWLFAALLVVGARHAGAQMTVQGTWVVVSADKDAGTVGDRITIRKAGDGYEILFDNGKSVGGYSGNDLQISRDYVFSMPELKEEFPGVPDKVLRQVLGVAHRRFTLAVENGGNTLVRSSNVGNVRWNRKRSEFTGYDDPLFIQRVTYSRVEGPAIAGLHVSSSTTGIFSCSRVDATKSGCVEVRNNSTRRVRLYLDELPGVQCTVDPGVYCSVPIATGTYHARIVADDDQGVGPTVNTMIDLTPDGVRILLDGDT